MVLTIAAMHNLEVNQMDVETAFSKWRFRRSLLHETTWEGFTAPG